MDLENPGLVGADFDQNRDDQNFDIDNLRLLKDGKRDGEEAQQLDNDYKFIETDLSKVMDNQTLGELAGEESGSKQAARARIHNNPSAKYSSAVEVVNFDLKNARHHKTAENPEKRSEGSLVRDRLLFSKNKPRSNYANNMEDLNEQIEIVQQSIVNLDKYSSGQHSEDFHGDERPSKNLVIPVKFPSTPQQDLERGPLIKSSISRKYDSRGQDGSESRQNPLARSHAGSRGALINMVDANSELGGSKKENGLDNPRGYLRRMVGSKESSTEKGRAQFLELSSIRTSNYHSKCSLLERDSASYVAERGNAGLNNASKMSDRRYLKPGYKGGRKPLLRRSGSKDSRLRGGDPIEVIKGINRSRILSKKKSRRGSSYRKMGGAQSQSYFDPAEAPEVRALMNIHINVSQSSNFGICA